MTRLSFLLIALFFCLALYSQQRLITDTALANSYGGLLSDNAKDIKQTSDKGFILAGTTSSFGQGNNSFYVVKTDSMGQHLWSRVLGTSENDVLNAVELAPDGGYYFSGFSNWNTATGYDAYVIKTNSNGDVQWTKNHGGSDWDFIYGSCLMPDGGLVICGETSDDIDAFDAYLLRLDNNGDTLWTRKMQLPGNGSFYAVKQKNNCIYVAGKSYDALSTKTVGCVYKLDFNGTVLNQDFFGGSTPENIVYNDLCFNATGRLILCGKRYSDTSQHCVLRQLDTANLNPLYYMTTKYNLYFNSLTCTNNGEIYAIGPANYGPKGQDILCLHYDSTFAQINYFYFGGKNSENGFKIIKTEKGYAMAGTTGTYGNRNNSKSDNAFLLLLTKANLADDYYLSPNEYFDDLSPVAIEEINACNKAFRVSPNPVTTFLHLSLSTKCNVETDALRLTDARGRILWQSSNLPLLQQETMTVDLTDFENGMYFLEVYSQGRLLTYYKVLRQN